jgi:hypothetical protein
VCFAGPIKENGGMENSWPSSVWWLRGREKEKRGKGGMEKAEARCDSGKKGPGNNDLSIASRASANFPVIVNWDQESTTPPDSLSEVAPDFSALPVPQYCAHAGLTVN